MQTSIFTPSVNILAKQLAIRARSRSSRINAVSQEVKTVEPETKTGTVDTIYIGKGRFIRDDPSKYPSKEDIGPFAGATGGWAGGEAALKKLMEELQAEKEALKGQKVEEKPVKATGTVPTTFAGKQVEAQVVGPGKDAIYIGYGKDDLEARKSGKMGKFIIDDGRKYPAKEDLAGLPAVTGGFAGGELGLKKFVADGEIPLLEPGQKPKQGQSPLVIAGFVSLAATLGGLALTKATDIGDNALRQEIVAAPIDENTKIYLELAVILLLVTGAVAGTRSIIKQVSDNLQKNLINFGKISAFWIGVFLAARLILEN